MYSSEKNPGINWKDIIIKIIFFIIFILVLMFLFKKPNMDAFYSNVFRENISYMQDAAISYYTTERLPKNVGDVAEMTLQDMIDKNLIIPFVDKDGNKCDTYASYVQITKQEDEYSLKVNLVCPEESSYVIKILGCYDYCESDICEKQEEPKEETKQTKTQYQFKQPYETTKYTTTCSNKDYTLVNGTCYKTSTLKTVDATPIYKSTDKLLATVETKTSKQVPYDCSTTSTDTSCTTKYRTETQKESYSCTKYKTETQKESYSCTKYKTEQQCTTTNKRESYSCNCTTKFVNGKYTTSCSTCYRTVPEKTCSNVSVPYTGTCTRDKQVSVPYTTTCTRNVEVSVPYTTTCTRNVEVKVPYSDCDTTTVRNPKTCYKTEVTSKFSCPAGTDTQTGSGKNLKCYDLVKTISDYKCPSKEYTFNSKTKKCTLTSTDTMKPVTTSKKVTEYKYKWSDSKTLDGWTATGKTRTVEI